MLERTTPKLIVNRQLRQYTAMQTGKLLGLSGYRLKCLEETGRGPLYHGFGEYITYREDHIRDWAIKNVHAPRAWFDRLEGQDPRALNRSTLIFNGKYYALDFYEEARLLMKMVYQPHFNADNRGAYELYRPDSPALVTTFVQNPWW